MRFRILIFALVLLTGGYASLPRASAMALQATARVEGRVLGPDRKPVDQAIVRLYDQQGVREYTRTTTNTAGRFEFTLSAGQYIVDIDPILNPGLERQRQDLHVIIGPNARGGDRVHMMFVLKPTAVQRRSIGTTFAQDVPAEARLAYERATKSIGGNREDALGALREALRIFPDYYDALEMLGVELVKDDKLDPAIVVLMRAVRVNPKGDRAHYALGVLYFKKKRYDLAVRAFGRADGFVPNDPNTLLYLGLSQARAGDENEAEATLKRAHELGARGVADLHLALAKIYSDSNRNREAAEQLKLLLRENPNLKDEEKIRELIAKFERKE